MRYAYVCILIGAVFGFATSESAAQVNVKISDQFSSLVKPLKPDPKHLNLLVYHIDEPNDFNDRYILVFTRKAMFRLHVVDDARIKGGDTSAPDLLDRAVSGPAVIDIPPALHGAGAVIASSDGMPPLGTVMYRVGRRPAKTMSQMKELLRLVPDALSKSWDLPRFTLELKPCGFDDAYSSPDVVICSELVSDLVERGLARALDAIVAHEMAHSLLALWGLPGANNEDVADEFAVMLVGDSPEVFDAYLKYFTTRDSLQEAAIQLQFGDRHTISAQRVRNMRAAAQQLPDIRARWSRLLAPYAVTASASAHNSPEISTPNASAEVNMPFDMAAISGVCESMSIDRVETKDNCSGNLVYLRQRDGGHALIFATVDGTFVAFSGPRIVSGRDQAYLQITSLPVKSGDANRRLDFHDAHGKCVFIPAVASPTRILCSAMMDNNAGTRSVVFNVTSQWRDKK